MQEIQRNYRTADGKPVLAERAEEDLQAIDEWLREGQRQASSGGRHPGDGPLHPLNAQRGQRYHVGPDLDLDTIGRELTRLVDLATSAAG